MMHNRIYHLCSGFLLVTLASAMVLPTPAQERPAMPGMPGMEHHHHDDAPNPGEFEKLGKVRFPVSCAASQQAPSERGIALLHSFGYTEAEAQFRAIAAADPTCAMAHWGIAMSQFHELWGRPDNAALKTGAEEMAKAKLIIALPTHVTSRELAYIVALENFYTQAPTDFQKAADSYAASMAALHAAYPDDIEAAAFYALAILASEAPDDTSLNKERAALAVLLPLFHDHPDHPGLAHYIIHTCDTPALAPQGKEAAEVYARIAPSSAHATHMPGHIFARLGMWQQDIDSNLASVAASNRAEAAHEPGVAHQMHADEFLIYAYLQVGEDEKARALTASMASTGKRIDGMPGMDDMKGSGPYFTNELNAIYAMEMHQWKVAEKLQPEADNGGSHRGSAALTTWWANGVGAGHLHDAKQARKALEKLDAYIASLKGTRQDYQAIGLAVPRDEVAGWLAYAENRPEVAVASVRKAADQQDKLGQGEVDIPAREMLGDLLMLEHKPKEALAEYKVALILSPNRLNGLLSAGAASEALGDRATAAAYYAQAAANTHHAAESNRPELRHAIAVLTNTPASGSQAE
jgi:tetratricopeptide (TPR) repeat protein